MSTQNITVAASGNISKDSVSNEREIADFIRVIKAAGADGIGSAVDRLPETNN